MKGIYVFALSWFVYLGNAQEFHPDSSWVFKNLEEVNTRYQECFPFWLDSSLLYTSNHPSLVADNPLNEHDQKVYRIPYVQGTWRKSKPLGLTSNAENNSALVGVDSTNYYFVRSSFNTKGDLFVSKRKGFDAGNLHPFVWRSETNEQSIIQRKGRYYFVTKFLGSYDIWERDELELSRPVDILNSSSNEVDLWISADGNYLFFSSDRPGGLGGYDIYRSSWEGKEWGTPILLLSSINTSGNDRHFRWYSNSLVFLASDRSGGKGDLDIWWYKRPDIIPAPVYKDSISVKKDSVPVIKKDSVILPPKPPVFQRDSLKKPVVHPVQHVLDSLGLEPFIGEIQLAAHAYSIKTILRFLTRYPRVDNINRSMGYSLRRDSVLYKGVVTYRFIVDKLYDDIDLAISDLKTYTNKSELPMTLEKRPFIALLKDKETRSRYAIFCIREDSGHTLLWITKDNEKIWEYRK